MEEAMIVRLDTMHEELQEIVHRAEQLQTVSVDELQNTCKLIEVSCRRLEKEVHLCIEKCSKMPPDKIKMYTKTQLKAEELKIGLEALQPPSPKDSFQSNTKLPKLALPKFKGEVLRWKEFWDRFQTSIDDKRLPDADKLSYLLGCLEDEALQTIEGLGVTHANYDIAVETLKSRYGKKQQVIDAHYDALHSQARATYNASECRSTLNNIERHLRVLESLGEEMEGNQFRAAIKSKFPEKIIYELHLLTEGKNMKEIRAGLDKIITAMEMSRSDTGTAHSTSTPEISTGALQARIELKSRPLGKWRREKQMEGSQVKEFQKRKGSCITGTTEMKRKRLKRSCIFCDGSHYNSECQTVKTIDERKKKLGQRCYLCFREGHRSMACPSKKTCYHCKKKHNQALCPQNKQGTTLFKEMEMRHINFSNESYSFLQTAVVKVRRQKANQSKVCRVLLDSGSQRSYITARLAKDLHLPTVNEDLLMIYVFGANKPVETISPSTEIEIETRRGSKRNIVVNIVPHITDRILSPAPLKNLCVDLAADDGSAGDRVDLLIGNDYYFTFIRNNIVQVEENLFLVDTEFGWIITGRTVEHNKSNTLSVITYCQCQEPGEPYFAMPDLPLQGPDIKFLWALESIGISDSPKITREEEAVKHFNQTVRYKDNRYEVKWPWIIFPPELPTNYGLVRGRLTGLLKRLDLETLKEYDSILQEQLTAKIIEVIDHQPNGVEQGDPPIHYLPHHIVKQEGKKGRIVYDASARLKDSKSLNECLYRGPSMLEDLTALLLRFRMNPIAIIADVEKAFLQVGLQIEDRDVTRFLWLKDIDKGVTEDNIMHLRFCRVPFGIISSPFLLTATIRYHLSKKPDALLNQLADQCYVDNLVTGSDTIAKARDLINKTRSSFNELSMNIREWISNSKQLMKSIPKQYRGKEEEKVKVLGLTWNIQKDTLKLKLNNNLLDPEMIAKNKTKRGVLRTLASLYDPCGYAAPLVLPAKLLLQELWKRKVKWDSPLSCDLEESWDSAVKTLMAAKDIEIQRFVGIIHPAETEYELHCFTDASQISFAAVVYLRMSDVKEQITKTVFIMAKSRVTPINQKEDLKIPKLELLGYVIGKRLLTYVKTALQVPITRQCLWTDSGIVIYWMKSEKLLPPFVARRISEIKEDRNIESRYVNTEENPADLATRPELWSQKKELWFNGPQFLLEPESRWPILPEGNSITSFAVLEDQDVNKFTEDIENEKSKPGNDRCIESSEEMDIEMTETTYQENGGNTPDVDNGEEVKKLQELYFPEEVAGKITHLSRNLSLFSDVEGLLRCKGRMMNTVCPYDTKYPILIPRDSEFTDKLIREIHEKNYHVGAPHTLSIIRQKYWIPQGKAKVQRVIKKCPQCVKHGGGPYRLPPIPALSAERANYSAPFTYTGMDYFGPIYVKGDGKQEKRWVCLYTCMAIRAVHMEVVNNLTAEECLLALRRFISARGVPELVVSDNALEFKLSAEILSSTYCIENKIRWKFIPQLSPWHGGFYERLVGLVKNCLKRTLGKQLLSSTQLNTIIKEVEAVTNSRPLTCVGTEIEYVLKPADFLTFGKCIIIEPSSQKSRPGGTVTKQGLVESWKKGQVILEEFKSMFMGQYLCSLRERYQNSCKQPRVKAPKPPSIGDIVQIKGDSKNRENWRVGRIISLSEGADGLCRVAKVIVEGKEFTRSIGHLYPLEIDENEYPAPQEHTRDPLALEREASYQESTIPINVPNGGEESSMQVEIPISQLVQTGNGLPQEEDGGENSALEQKSEDSPMNSQGRLPRKAAERAKEKIALWTSQLASLL